MGNALENSNGSNIEEAAELFWKLDDDAQESILSILRSLLSEQ